MNYAVIEDNKVINLIVADNKEIAEEVTGLTCIDTTDGWDYDSGIDGGVFFPKPEEFVEVVEHTTD
jgi:hypothetical protein